MKLRILAFLLALTTHAVLLSADFEWTMPQQISPEKIRTISMTISRREPVKERPAIPNVKQKTRTKTRKKKLRTINVRIKPTRKPLRKPTPPRPKPPSSPTPLPSSAESAPSNPTAQTPETLPPLPPDFSFSFSAIPNVDNNISPQNSGTVSEEVRPDRMGKDRMGTDDGGNDNSQSIEAVPLYHVNPPPLYPRMARRRGYSGTVILEVLVNEQGRVGRLRVFETSGYPLLDKSALKTVEDWAFEPGSRGGEKIEMWVRIPVKFQLRSH